MASKTFIASAQDEFSKQRAEKLDQCARSLEKVKVDKVDKPVSRVSDGRQYSKASELHMLFQACASGVENEGQDGVLIFGIQCSGFTSVVDPRASGGTGRRSRAA